MRPPIEVLAGRYRLISLLGKGGMGSVWRGEHVSLGTPVAVKLLDPRLAEKDSTKARFLREARAAAALRSRHVVQILDHGVEEGHPYIVMELLHGESLGERLHREKTLAPPVVARILAEVGLAIARAHKAGVVHRDLKPDNVFLADPEEDVPATDGGRWIVKVVDFGVAKLLDGAKDDVATTETGAMVGTPHYMSPEQARGAKGIDGRSDLWSMAIIAFECLLGRRPFQAGALGELVLLICTEEPPVPSSIGPVPEGFDAWFARATHRKIEERFQDVAELVGALEDVLTPGLHRFAPAAPEDRRSVPVRAPDPAELEDTFEVGATPEAERATATSPRPPAAEAALRSAAPPAAASGGALPIAPPRGNETSIASPLTPSRWPRVAAALIVTAVGAAAVMALSGRPDAPAPVASSSSSARATTSASAAITGFVDPPSRSPEALASYRSGLRALRDASIVGAVDDFERAAALDPELAEAHLRFVVHAMSRPSSVLATHVASARRLRERLSPRDRKLLEVAETRIEQPPRPGARVEAATRLVDTFPADPESRLVLAMALRADRRPTDALLQLDRAIEADPAFGAAMWAKALIQVAQGDEEPGFATIARCLERIPASPTCLRLRARMMRRRGNCNAYLDISRKLLDAGDDLARSRFHVASALIETGASDDAVRDAFAQGASDPDAEIPVPEANLLVASGDFEGALAAVQQREYLLPAGATELQRAPLFTWRIRIALELGDEARARAEADRYVERMAGWSVDAPHLARPWVLAVRRRAGSISPAEHQTLLGQWQAAAENSVVFDTLADTWTVFHAMPATTKEEALAALEALPQPGPTPGVLAVTDLPAGEALGAIGRVHLLAGKPEEALPWLTRATRECTLLDAPIAKMHAQLDRGQALEKLGKTEDACHHYGEVLRRWGRASKSITQKAARAASERLRCKKEPAPPR